MGCGRSLQHDDALLAPAHLCRYCVHADICVDWIHLAQWQHLLSMLLTLGSTNGRKCRCTDHPSDMNQHYAVRNTSVTSYSLRKLQLVGHLQTRTDTYITGRYTTSRCIFIHCTLYHPAVIRIFICYHLTIRVLTVLSYNAGIWVLTVLSSYYNQGTHGVTVRVLIVLSSHYHQDIHGVVSSTA
jgi:hypothetical protein